MPVIIWINGGFGAGKTTLAEELHRRLPDAVVYDPEDVGLMLWKWMRPDGDFQHLPSWRELVVATALSLRRHRNRPRGHYDAAASPAANLMPVARSTYRIRIELSSVTHGVIVRPSNSTNGCRAPGGGDNSWSATTLTTASCGRSLRSRFRSTTTHWYTRPRGRSICAWPRSSYAAISKKPTASGPLEDGWIRAWSSPLGTAPRWNRGTSSELRLSHETSPGDMIERDQVAACR